MNTTTKRQFKIHNYRGVNMNRCHGGYYTEGRSIQSGKTFTAGLTVNLADMRKFIDIALALDSVTSADGKIIVNSDSQISAVQHCTYSR